MLTSAQLIGEVLCSSSGTEPKASSPVDVDDKSSLLIGLQAAQHRSVHEFVSATRDDKQQQQVAAGHGHGHTLSLNVGLGVGVGPGVVRLAPAMKLEPEGMPVEGVIKTAPGKLHLQEQLSPKDPQLHLHHHQQQQQQQQQLIDVSMLQHPSTASVLQEMHPMRPTPFPPTVYDPYSGAAGPAVYGRICADPTAAYSFGPMQPQLLPTGTPMSGYPNLLTAAPSQPEIYYSRPGEPYYGGVRPPLYHTAETTEELIARYNCFNMCCGKPIPADTHHSILANE